MFEKVLEYFREICSIPHGSGNTGFISDFCTDFAVSHSLRYIRDKMGNIIIFKDGTSGYETSRAVIIQGHLDMVCVKKPDCALDMKTQGLKLIETEDFIEADGTSLGGDDGIAVAYALALLDSDDIPHPPLEVVLTVDEETGMLGANAIDLSALTGKMLINIDSEEEDTLLVSCAGGVRADASASLDFEETQSSALKVTLGGLTGGHSGTEINKGRQNAIISLAKLLSSLSIRLCSLSGGNADNAIPSSCCAVIVCKSTDETKAQLLASFEKLKKDSPNDSGMKLEIETVESQKALSEKDSQKILACLCEVPDGVISTASYAEDLVQTSLNLGIAEMKDNKLLLTHALRSSSAAEKEKLKNDLSDYYSKFGFAISFYGDYPAWEYQENSLLQKVICEAYEEMHGEKMNVASIHAGLECGVFCGKIGGLDCVSLGPDIFDIHTADEKLSKKSAEKVFSMLVKVLEKLI
ncbi:MAG: beta-Ala-His dipeptidase [Acutalibacteraceae bacterium]